jgi:DNA-nicking Smr family endonuclease
VISKDDRKIFELATHDVRPIKTADRVVARTVRPSAHARLSRAADLETLEESLNGELIEPAEEVGFRRPGLSELDFRRLRQGRFSIEDEIDLHGLNRAEARVALRVFLGEAIERRLGCVRVVHGKGSRSGPHGPVLKNRVHYWLSQWDEVLAFVSARRRHGGSGAVYVLLR